jgi:hypothetical protein
MFCSVVLSLLDLDEEEEADRMLEDLWASPPPEIGFFPCRLLSNWLMDTGRAAEACALIEDTIERRGKIEGERRVEEARVELAMKRAKAGIGGVGELLRLALASARASNVPQRITSVLAGVALADPDPRAARAAFDEWSAKTGPDGEGEPHMVRLYHAALAAKRLNLPAEAARLLSRLEERASRLGSVAYLRLIAEAKS